MCGIVGVIGTRAAAPLILDSLRRLEYRGYDSAGIATLVNGHIERRRAEGKLRNLEVASATLVSAVSRGEWPRPRPLRSRRCSCYGGPCKACVVALVGDEFRDARIRLKLHCAIGGVARCEDKDPGPTEFVNDRMDFATSGPPLVTPTACVCAPLFRRWRIRWIFTALLNSD